MHYRTTRKLKNLLLREAQLPPPFTRASGITSALSIPIVPQKKFLSYAVSNNQKAEESGIKRGIVTPAVYQSFRNDQFSISISIVREKACDSSLVDYIVRRIASLDLANFLFIIMSRRIASLDLANFLFLSMSRRIASRFGSRLPHTTISKNIF